MLCINIRNNISNQIKVMKDWFTPKWIYVQTATPKCPISQWMRHGFTNKTRYLWDESHVFSWCRVRKYGTGRRRPSRLKIISYRTNNESKTRVYYGGIKHDRTLVSFRFEIFASPIWLRTYLRISAHRAVPWCCLLLLYPVKSRGRKLISFASAELNGGGNNIPD